MIGPAQVISLRRSQDRRAAFAQRNAASGLAFAFVDGVDGVEQWPAIARSRRVSKAWRDGWGQGAIGAALSHCMLWRRCLARNRPICVLEDDVLVAAPWPERWSQLLEQLSADLDLVLLGWNLDSVLRAELFPGVGCISLFEPAYPTLRAVLDDPAPRRLCRLQKALGLPGYLITPSGARKLLHGLARFEAEPLEVGRGIPTIAAMTLDAQMNRLYPQLNAVVVVPPLVLAENNQQTSMTAPRAVPRQFGDNPPPDLA